MKYNLKNVKVDSVSFENTYAAAGWELNGARYHVWFDLKTMEIHKGTDKDYRTIYKNPPLSVKYGDPDYFNTRYLNVNNETNSEIIRQVFSVIAEKGLIAKALDHKRQGEIEQENKNKIEYYNAKVKEAGPELLAAIRAILFQVIQGPVLERDACIQQAREVFNKLEKERP